GQILGTDPAGNPIANGAIYDPATRTTLSSGSVVMTAFPGNIIPQSRFSPIAVKIQNLYPAVTNSNQTNNFAETCNLPLQQQGPTIKIDQNLPDGSKLAFYYQHQTTYKINNNAFCLPYPISQERVQSIYGKVPRLNYDKAITPTILLHAGVGMQRFYNPDSSPPEV